MDMGGGGWRRINLAPQQDHARIKTKTEQSTCVSTKDIVIISYRGIAGRRKNEYYSQDIFIITMWRYVLCCYDDCKCCSNGS